jgi:regulator of protease activity HflC (stomatin/prohibitin superfamily)
VVVLFAGCSKVPAGYKGIKVYLLGGDKGVEREELGVGRYWIGINEELYLFPTFTQNVVWTQDPTEGSPTDESITFQTVEGMEVGADIGISYRILPDRVDSIFQKYRKGIDEITDIYLRNMVRDAFTAASSTKEVENVYGKGKTELLAEVEENVRQQVGSIGIEVERIYFVGKLRLPDNVTGALNAKIEATQKAQQRENEVREAEAEAAKTVATAEGEAKAILRVAEAQAKANRIIAASITSQLISYKSIEKWDGIMPRLMSGNGGGMIPLINIDK